MLVVGWAILFFLPRLLPCLASHAEQVLHILIDSTMPLEVVGQAQWSSTESLTSTALDFGAEGLCSERS